MNTTEHTHHCDDCDLGLALMYDDREDNSVSIVCGHCAGTNTRSLDSEETGR